MVEKSRVLRIRLHKSKRAGGKYAARTAIRRIKEHIKKHFRVPVEKVLLSRSVNEAVWKKGGRNVPTCIETEVLEEKGMTRVFLKAGKEKEAFLAQQKRVAEKAKKAVEEAKKKEVAKTEEEKKAAEEQKAEQEKKLEEKRLKESIAEKAGMT